MNLEQQSEKPRRTSSERESSADLKFQQDSYETIERESFAPSDDSQQKSGDSGSETGETKFEIPENIAKQLEGDTASDIEGDAAGAEKAADDPKKLQSSIENAVDGMIDYNVAVNGDGTKTFSIGGGKMPVETSIGEDGRGKTKVDGVEHEIDLSTAEKVFQSTRSSTGEHSGNIEVASKDFGPDNAEISRLSVMANGTQKIQLPSGDVLHRPLKNAEGVKWIKDVGGEDGGQSVIAYEDGRREIRYTKPREDGLKSVEIGADGKVTSVKFDESREKGDESEKDSPDKVENSKSEEFKTKHGVFKQNYDQESGKVTTEFPAGLKEMESLPGADKIESITYDPKNAEEPYSVKMKEGQENAELESQIKAKLKEGGLSLPVEVRPQGEGEGDVDKRPDLFPKRWNSTEASALGEGEFSLNLDGSMEYRHENDPDGRIKTTKFPPNHPDGLVSRTEYDTEKTAALNDDNAAKNLQTLEKYKDDQGRESTVKRFKHGEHTETVYENGNYIETSNTDTEALKAKAAELTGWEANDPRLNGLKSVAEMKGDKDQVTFTYDQEALKDTENSDLRTLTLTKGPEGQSTETYSYDGSKHRATRQLDRDKDGKLLRTTENGIAADGKGYYLQQIDHEKGTWTHKEGDVERTGKLDENGELPEDLRPKLKEETEGEGEKLELTGKESQFVHGSEKGSLYTDDKTGYLNGIKFTEGNRAGQEYQFSHDEAGNLTGMKIKVPQEGGESKEVTLTKDGDKWKIDPKDATIPQFENMQIDAEGNITGDLKVKADGDIVYDAGDGNKEVLRIEGIHDKYNLNDYQRIRETADGKSKTEFWDGYNWREGEMTKGEVNGKEVTTVTFKGEGKVKQIIRDASEDKETGVKSDKVTVVRNDGTVYNADWASNHMTRKTASDNEPVDLYNTGLRDAKGDRVWMRGAEDNQGRIHFQPETTQQQELVRSGKSPAGAQYHGNGDVTSYYLGNKKVTSDSEGRVNEIEHGNNQKVKFQRDAYGEVLSVEGIGGKKLVRSEHLSGEGEGPEYTRWKVEGGQPGETYDATLQIGADHTVKLSGADNIETTIEGNGRSITKQGDEIVAAVDSQGQRWLRETREGETEEGKEPWTVMRPDGSKHTFAEGGSLKLMDDGGVGVEYADGHVESAGSDGSLSTYNKDGVETKIVHADGTHILRDDQGYLTEVKSKNADGEFDVRKFEIGKGADGKPVIKGVTLNGKPSEVFVDGKFRELKDGAGFDTTDPAKLGNYVKYDATTGTREVRESEDPKSLARTVHELDGTVTSYDAEGKKTERQADGTVRKYDGEGNLTDGTVHDAKSGTTIVMENGKVKQKVVEDPETGVKITADYVEGKLFRETVENDQAGLKAVSQYEDGVLKSKVIEHAESGTIRELQYANGDDTIPEKVYQSTKGSEKVLIAERVREKEGIPAKLANAFDVYPDGKVDGAEPVAGQFDPRSGKLIYQNVDKATGEKIGTWVSGVDGKEALIINQGQVAMIKEGDKLLMGVGEDGMPREFVYDDQGNLSHVQKPVRDGDPVVTDKVVDGKLMQVDPNDSEKILGPSNLDPSNYDLETGKLKVEQRNENGELTGSLVRYPDGREVQYDADGKITLARKAGEWEETYENGVRQQRKFDGYKDIFADGKRVSRQLDNGASIQFDPESGRMTKMVDKNGVERTFKYRDQVDGKDLPPGAPNDIVEVSLRDTRVEGSEPEVVEKMGKDKFLHPVEEGKESELVFYRQAGMGADSSIGDRITYQTYDIDENGRAIHKTATVDKLDGRRFSKEAGQSLKLVGFGESDQHDATGGAHFDDVRKMSAVEAGRIREAQEATYKFNEIEESKRGTAQSLEEATVDHQLEALRRHADNLPKGEGERLKEDLKAFKERAEENGLSEKEVAQTLYYANRLMETKAVEPLSQSDLTRTSLALMHGAAHPLESNHGFHRSVATTTTRESMLLNNPSKAGRIANAALIDGEMTVNSDGSIASRGLGGEVKSGSTKIKFDAASLVADGEALASAANSGRGGEAGYRDQLGQVMDHALINYAHIKAYNASHSDHIEDAPYTQETPRDAKDTGERLHFPGEEPKESSTLSFSQLAEMNKVLLGQEQFAVNSSVDNNFNREGGFDSAATMTGVLQSGLENGPMTLLVNANHPAFGKSSAEGEEWDLVNVHDSKVVNGTQYYKLSGFHGGKSNEQWLSEADLFNSTLESRNHTAGLTNNYIDDLNSENVEDKVSLDLSTFNDERDMALAMNIDWNSLNSYDYNTLYGKYYDDVNSMNSLDRMYGNSGVMVA